MGVSQTILFSVISLAGVGVITFRQFFTEPKSKIKLAKYSARCIYCGKRKGLRISQVCNATKRIENCEIEEDHSHIVCECGAEYAMKTLKYHWYEFFMEEL
jgi:anaerobic selenocysteine-containing dehydrogenase